MLILFIALCAGLIYAAYRFAWPGTGFLGKTIWDWLQLLIIPLVLTLAAVFFNQANTRTERQIAQQQRQQDQSIAQQRYKQDQNITLDKQREELLQAYLDRMSELLLKEKLSDSQPNEPVRKVARVRTVSILIQLDARRIGYVFVFLREAKLLESSNPIVDLSQIDLAQADWSRANLSQANLSRANLNQADLNQTDLSQTDLSQTDLRAAILNGADLRAADLSGADLRMAKLSGAKLDKASLSGADLSGANLSHEPI